MTQPVNGSSTIPSTARYFGELATLVVIAIAWGLATWFGLIRHEYTEVALLTKGGQHPDATVKLVLGVTLGFDVIGAILTYAVWRLFFPSQAASSALVTIMVPVLFSSTLAMTAALLSLEASVGLDFWAGMDVMFRMLGGATSGTDWPGIIKLSVTHCVLLALALSCVFAVANVVSQSRSSE